MSPRPYQLGKRQGAVDEARHRVVAAARDLLAGATTVAEFTVNAVAVRAGVARATVYYQFGSKTGLLEALCDALAEAGQMGDLAAAFTEPDPEMSLRLFIGCFGGFWDSDRLVMRRVRALAVLDPEIGAVIERRDARRRAGLEVLAGRLAERDLLVVPPATAARILCSLTSFETFDALAAAGQALTEVVPEVIQLAGAVLAESSLGT